jgi:hypothetical protein
MLPPSVTKKTPPDQNFHAPPENLMVRPLIWFDGFISRFYKFNPGIFLKHEREPREYFKLDISHFLWHIQLRGM